MQKADAFRGKVRIGIITIREDEYSELLGFFPETTIVDGGTERRYRLTRLTCLDGKEITIAITRCIEQGNIEAQNTTSDFIKDLDPEWLFVVGIAGGVPDSNFSLGDVIISSRVYDLTLESSKPNGGREYSIKGVALHPLARKVVEDLPGLITFELQGWHHKVKMERPVISLNELEPQLSGDAGWKEKIKDSITKHFTNSRPPLALPGAIASSDRMVKDPEITEDWKKIARHFLAVEMELAGVCRAAEEKPVLGIRGISDIVGMKKDKNELWVAYACKTAAAFAVSLITSGILPSGAVSAEGSEKIIPPRENAINQERQPDKNQSKNIIENRIIRWSIAILTLLLVLFGVRVIGPLIVNEPETTSTFTPTVTWTTFPTSTSTLEPTFTQQPPEATFTSTPRPSATPIPCLCASSTDYEAISCLIHKESEAANQGDLGLIARIFAPNAVILQGDTGETWDDPLSYYRPTYNAVKFNGAFHDDLKQVKVMGGTEYWVSKSGGKYTLGGRTYSIKSVPDSDHWIFEKNQQGCWVVIRFEFNASHLTFPPE